MASPLVRRQITILPIGSSTPRTSTTSTTPPSPSPTPSTTTVPGLIPSLISGVTSIVGPTPSTASSVAQSVSPSSSSTTTDFSASSVSPGTTPPLQTTGPGGPVTVTQTTSDGAPPPSGTSESKGKSFLQNKPLSGFVFGLAGLAFFILVFICVSSYVRRRNRKRLLADASNFSFDPRDVEDATSDEKHSGLVRQHSSGHGHDDYPPDSRVAAGFTGAGTGSISRPGPVRSPPIPTYVPRDYMGHDGGYPSQYHNLGNVPVGYNPTPNPHDMYGPRNGGRYPNRQGQQDPYHFPGPNGDYPMNGPSPTAPRQLQPGIHPAQGSNFAPHLSGYSPPTPNYALQIPQTTSPPHYLRPSVSDKDDFPRLPTPAPLPETFGRRGSPDDVEDDAYGGVYLGPESPPGQRSLQVANM